jgi:hypothetical protein
MIESSYANTEREGKKTRTTRYMTFFSYASIYTTTRRTERTSLLIIQLLTVVAVTIERREIFLYFASIQPIQT